MTDAKRMAEGMQPLMQSAAQINSRFLSLLNLNLQRQAADWQKWQMAIQGGWGVDKIFLFNDPLRTW